MARRSDPRQKFWRGPATGTVTPRLPWRECRGSMVHRGGDLDGGLVEPGDVDAAVGEVEEAGSGEDGDRWLVQNTARLKVISGKVGDGRFAPSGGWVAKSRNALEIGSSPRPW
jgi:hypothetical protein